MMLEALEYLKPREKDIIIKIYNFYIFASYKKNIQSHSILRKCDFEDLKELKFLEEIFNEIKFIPTGGINNENKDNYLALNNVLAVGSTNI